MIKLKDLLLEARQRFKKGDFVKIRRRASGSDIYSKIGFRKGDFGEIMKIHGPGTYIVTDPGHGGQRGGREDVFWDDELQKLTAADRRKLEKQQAADDEY